MDEVPFEHFLSTSYVQDTVIDSRDIEMNETWHSHTIGKGFQVKRQGQVMLCTVKEIRREEYLIQVNVVKEYF